MHFLIMSNLFVCKTPIWGLDGSAPDDAPLPILPDNGRVVDMLLCIQEVQRRQSVLLEQGLLVCADTPHFEQLLAASNQAVLACSGLSACLLTIIKGLPPSPDNQVFAATIQSLSYDIAQAGKLLCHLVKNGPSLGNAPLEEDTCYSDSSVI